VKSIRIFFSNGIQNYDPHRTAPRTPRPRQSRPSTRTPPCRSHPAAPPSLDLLGEPRLRSSCPAPPWDPAGAHRRTMPSVNPHRAAVERATTSVHALAPRGDHAGTRAARGPQNRGPAGLPAGHAWQGVGLSTVAVGRISARHCAMF
jgi:hypothetical protein